MPVVTMVDTFMSGWGGADGKTNIYAVHCDTDEQATQIAGAAARRDEMEKVKIHDELPYYGSVHYVVSEKDFHDLGPIWTGEED